LLSTLTINDPLLQNSIVYAENILQSISQDSNSFYDILARSFGTNYDPALAESIRGQWASGDFSQLPQIVVLSSGMDNCLGAYAASTNTIYINQSLIDGSQSADFINDILLEEIGHGINNITNANSTGETGAIFSTLAQGGSLTSDQIAAYQAESDLGTITVDGQPVAVQMAGSVTSASFTSMSPDNGFSAADFITNQTSSLVFSGRATTTGTGIIYIWLFDGSSTTSLRNFGFNGAVTNISFSFDPMSTTLSAGTHSMRLANSGNTTTYATQTVIIDTNAPTIISSSSTASVPEHAAASTSVYTIVGSDTGGSGVYFYGLSGTDASYFTVNGSNGTVTINSSPNYATKSSYSFNVTATDKAGNIGTKTLTLSITNVAPVVTATTISYTDSAANDPFTSSTGTITATDAGATITYGISGVTATSGSSSKVGTYGTLTVATGGSYTYTPNNLNTLIAGSYSDVFNVTASDGSLTGTKTFTVSIAGANDTPVFTSNPVTLSYTDTANSDTFSSSIGVITATDAEGTTATYGISGATVISGSSTKTGTYGTLTLTTGGSYTYTPNSLNTLTASNYTDTFTLTATDGSSNATQAFTVNITGANDTPAFTSNQVTLSYTDTAGKMIHSQALLEH